ncbi:MAG: hypothetical protein SVY15_09265 [Halobacteriota archaeon]|nr:hypothetical protein [Halobacteriota archaeon]
MDKVACFFGKNRRIILLGLIALVLLVAFSGFSSSYSDTAPVTVVSVTKITDPAVAGVNTTFEVTLTNRLGL